MPCASCRAKREAILKALRDKQYAEALRAAAGAVFGKGPGHTGKAPESPQQATAGQETT